MLAAYHFRHRFGKPFKCGHRRGGGLEHLARDIGWLEPCAGSIKESCVEYVFETADRVCYRGLRDAQLCRGPADGTVDHHGAENFELAKRKQEWSPVWSYGSE